VHLVHVPLSSEFTSVSPSVNTLALNVVVFKVSGVGGAVSPVELSFAVFLSIIVVAFVLSIVGPDLFAVSMLLILVPVSFVLGAISVMVASEAMGLIVLPFSVIYISISMDESTTSIGLVLTPVALVNRSVDPELFSLAFLQSILVPVSVVPGTVLESHLFFQSELRCIIADGLGVVVECAELFLNLTDNLLSLDLLFIVSVIVAFHSLGLEPILNSDSSASHVSSEMSLDLGDGVIIMRCSCWLSSLNDCRAFTLRVVVMLIFVGLTASCPIMLLFNN